jgi:hypothetical protein
LKACIEAELATQPGSRVVKRRGRLALPGGYWLEKQDDNGWLARPRRCPP